MPHFTHTAFFHIVLLPEVLRNGHIRHEPDIVLMGRNRQIYRSRNALCPQAQQPNVALKQFGHFVRSSCDLPVFYLRSLFFEADESSAFIRQTAIERSFIIHTQKILRFMKRIAISGT